MRWIGILTLNTLTLAGVGLGAVPAPQQGAPVYQESGGIVVVEMESIPVWSSYVLDTTYPGYSGSGYYTWSGRDLPNQWPNFEPLTPTGTPVLFNITTPGVYQLRFHWWEAVDWNAIFLQMDDEPGGWQDNKWQLIYAPPPAGRWTWETYWDAPGHPQISFNLTAGVHRLTIAGGTTGIGLDRFHLFLDSVANPLDLSRPQSSTTGSGGGGGGGGGGLPSPWQQADVGSVGVAGNATYSNGTFTVSGSGSDIWGSADGFHFVYRTLTGDGEIVARVTDPGAGGSWIKSGVMIREDLSAGSANAATFLTPGNGIDFQRRKVAGGPSTYTAGPMVGAPQWVRLVRSGDTFTSYNSADGTTWTQVGVDTIPMASSVYAGLAVSSLNNSSLTTATMDSSTLTASGGGGGGSRPSGAGSGRGKGSCGIGTATGVSICSPFLLVSIVLWSLIRRRSGASERGGQGSE